MGVRTLKRGGGLTPGPSSSWCSRHPLLSQQVHFPSEHLSLRATHLHLPPPPWGSSSCFSRRVSKKKKASQTFTNKKCLYCVRNSGVVFNLLLVLFLLALLLLPPAGALLALRDQTTDLGLAHAGRRDTNVKKNMIIIINVGHSATPSVPWTPCPNWTPPRPRCFDWTRRLHTKKNCSPPKKPTNFQKISCTFLSVPVLHEG